MLKIKNLFLYILFSIFSLNISAFPYEKPQKDDPDIIIAVKNKDLDRLNYLIENNVDLEAKGILNETALVWAFYFMWLDGAKRLIDAGANVHHEDEGVNLWNILMLSSRSKKNDEARAASLELFDILKNHKVTIKPFECENLDDIREYSKGNPELAKSFFKEIRFKKGFWWLYRFIYIPFMRVTDVACWLEKNAGHWDEE
ncbi:MAG: hypothetical protein ABIF12_01925 [bacterium]